MSEMTKLFSAHLACFNCLVFQDEKLEFLVSILPSNSSYLFKFKLNEQAVILNTDKLSFFIQQKLY